MSSTTNTTNVDTDEGASPKPRLKTSSMIASIAGEGQRTKPAPFGTPWSSWPASRPEIIGMTADLGKYTDLHIFQGGFPDRYYQMGMAEQLLMGRAAGLRTRASCPSPTTYAVFARAGPTTSSTRRSPRRTST
jgi:transketolase